MPTSELPSHLSLHNYLIGCGKPYKASLHTHPIELVAMSHSSEFKDSAHLTDVLNKAACIYMRARSMGFVPEGMTREQMQGIRDAFNLPSPKNGLSYDIIAI